MNQVFSNNAVTALVGSVGGSDNIMTVANGSAFPALSSGSFFLATLIEPNANGNEVAWEIIKVIDRNGNTLSVVRGQEGTAARAWPDGAVIEARLTAGTLAAKAPLDSPAFTGMPTAPTPAAGTNTKQVANTAFVQAALAALVDSSPAALDTLNELAAALGDDPNFATTMATELGKKLDASQYTAADVLAKMKTVDGAGSGLDADQLDGQDSAFYRSASNLNAGTIPNSRLPSRLASVAATISDWDAALDNGWYMGSNAANAPEVGAVWFLGSVEAHGAAGYRTQTVHGFTSDGASDTKTWRRDQNNGAWGSWYRLRLSEAEQRAIYLDASNMEAGTLPIDRVPKLALSHLSQSGAVIDQVPVWNGTAWVPGDMKGGGSGVSLDGPGTIFITQSAQFTISDYDVFTDYVVQASAGSVSISGDTISFTAPMTAGSVTLTVFAGDYQRDITLEILPERPAAPAITSPATTGVMGNPTLSTGAFSLIGPNADTHAATDWEIWTGAGRSGALVWSSLNNSASKLSITLPQNTLAVATDYHMAVRHIGATFGAGEWAELAFRTADQFLPTVFGQPFGGGFYAGKIKVGADTYIIIDAGKASETTLALKTANTATAGTSSYNDGWANCQAMNNSTHPAVQYCRNYRGGGHDDWYLASRDEHELRYRNFKPDATANITGARGESGSHGDNANSVPAGASYTAGSPAQTSAAAFKAGGAEAFTVPTWYWTSTEYAPNTLSAWIQRFSDGYQASASKGNASLVRPVRRLKI